MVINLEITKVRGSPHVAADVIAHHKGAERELGILKVLRAGFGAEHLESIDRDRVRAWMTSRRQKNVGANTVNR